MKRSMLIVFALTLVVYPLAQAGVEPSPFKPKVNRLYAIDHQLQNIGKRVDHKLNRLLDDNLPSPALNGVVNSILVINKKLVNIDKMQTLIVNKVLASCDPLVGCTTDDGQTVADALQAMRVSGDAIIASIQSFLNTFPGDSIHQEIITAVTQVLQTAQQVADNARIYSGMFSFPDITTYCHGEFNRIIIETHEYSISYKVVFPILDSNPYPATGSRNGDNLTLNATIQGFDLSYQFTFLNNDQNIEGQILAEEGGHIFILNEWGVRGSCPTVDIESDGIPQFIDYDFVDLTQIENISLFRSAAGHDYSDGFETCRSMKHYFAPELKINDTVFIYSPVDGTVVSLFTEEENFIDDGRTNQRVVIQPDDQPAILIILFHVDLLDPPVIAGTNVSTGQLIGYARMIRNGGPPSHNFDVALDASTDDGIRFISYFDAMTDPLYSNYTTWGSGPALWNGFIISEPERDADPLDCNDGAFISFGSLPSWYYSLQ